EVGAPLQLGRDVRNHGEYARDMEPAEADLNAFGAKDACDIHGARILIRLHAYQCHHGGLTGQTARDTAVADVGVDFVVGGDFDFDVVTEDATGGAVERKAVHYGESFRR